MRNGPLGAALAAQVFLGALAAVSAASAAQASGVQVNVGGPGSNRQPVNPINVGRADHEMQPPPVDQSPESKEAALHTVQTQA